MIVQLSVLEEVDDLPIFEIGELPILPYPGNKRKYAKQFLGCEQHDALLSPFLGSGALELISDTPLKFVADADVAIHTQWRYILDGRWGEILSGVRHWQRQVADEISTPGFAAYCSLPAGRRREAAKECELALFFMRRMDSVWRRLLCALESPLALEVAIADLCVRKLGYMSVVRLGKRGALNIKWMTDKLSSFVNFQGQQPTIKSKWRLQDDCFKAISDFKAADVESAISIIDPPYWLPWVAGVRNQMTPAYRNHKPHADETFELCVESLRQTALSPSVRRMVYCNYWSDEMNAAVDDVASGWNVEKLPLKTLAKGRLDHAWIFSRKE